MALTAADLITLATTSSADQIRVTQELLQVVTSILLEEFIAAVWRELPNTLDGLNLKMKIATGLMPLGDLEFMTARVLKHLETQEKTA